MKIRNRLSPIIACMLSGLAILSVGLVLAGCGGGPTFGPRQLIALAVQPSDADAFVASGTFAFSAIGTFDQAPITQTNFPARWASLDPGVAAIDPNTGVATCVAEGGPIIITASAAGKRGSVEDSGTLTCLPSTPPTPGALGRCIVQSDSTMSGYCVGVRGGVCREAYDPINCPPGGQPTGVVVDQCAHTTLNVDASRSCIP